MFYALQSVAVGTDSVHSISLGIPGLHSVEYVVDCSLFIVDTDTELCTVGQLLQCNNPHRSSGGHHTRASLTVTN